ncbi:hypothetical protein H7198_01620 [Fructobacillus sp. CRL 2054]|uniref:phage tail tube assembly chaperone n=1 Tax=Fructobacillus sp. CRL 2054 TaxID=2763007 RepID=UPI00237846B7|nr:hypothetical protein [Fructobacillus sp. CRL 2054]MDD9138311.1 hypothetical protein [Fructobacillus sp. CRL 2054]
MTVKISVLQELGIRKKIEIKETNANMRKTFEFQRGQARLQVKQAQMQKQMEKASDDTSAAKGVDTMFTSMLENMANTQEYITDMLGLDEEHQEKLDNLDFNETIDLSTKITSAILKVEPEENTGEVDDLKA